MGATIRAGVVTVSDSCYRGQKVDESGPEIARFLERTEVEVTRRLLVPDDYTFIRAAIVELADDLKLDLILTTGGTGISPRDVTPEATLSLIERQIPGISQGLLIGSLKKTPRAMLSRGVAGIRKGKTIIINLPGSPKAVRECMEILLPVLQHAVDILHSLGHSGP